MQQSEERKMHVLDLSDAEFIQYKSLKEQEQIVYLLIPTEAKQKFYELT